MPGRLRTASRPSRTWMSLAPYASVVWATTRGSPLDGWVKTVMRSPHAPTRTGCRASEAERWRTGPETAPVAVTPACITMGAFYQRSALFSGIPGGVSEAVGTHPDLDGGRRRRRPARPAAGRPASPRGTAAGSPTQGRRRPRRARRPRAAPGGCWPPTLGPTSSGQRCTSEVFTSVERAAEMAHQPVQAVGDAAPARGLGVAGNGSHGMGRVYGPPATAGPGPRQAGVTAPPVDLQHQLGLGARGQARGARQQRLARRQMGQQRARCARGRARRTRRRAAGSAACRWRR